MHQRGHHHIGVLLIFIGAIFLIAQILHVNPWSLLWPLLLIGLGVWLLVRHKHVEPDTNVTQKFIGDIHCTGDWDVTNTEVRIFIGDVELDMTQAKIPDGTTNINVFGFIGDLHILVPKSVGISVTASGFITEAKMGEEKQEKFFASVRLKSDNYDSAKRKISLETTYFIQELKVRQV